MVELLDMLTTETFQYQNLISIAFQEIHFKD